MHEEYTMITRPPDGPSRGVQVSPPPGPIERPTRLLNKNFTLLLQGQFLSRTGTSLASLAMVLWIIDATKSASLMGLLYVLSSLPAVVFGVIGGAVADRYSRRNVIAYCDIASGLALLLLGVLFFLVPDDRGTLALAVISLSTLVAVFDAFSTPAISAAIPDMVPPESMAQANSLGQISFQLASLIGQGLGGLLYGFMGALGAAVCNGLTCLYSGVTESFMTISQQIPEAPARWQDRMRDFKRDMTSGFRQVISTPGLNKLVLLSSFVTFFSSPLIMLIPFYVKEFLGLSDEWVGYLGATYGLGTLFGSLAAGIKHVGRNGRRRVIIWSMILQSIGFAILGVLRDPVAAFSLVCIGGILTGLTGVYIVTIIQATTPSEVRGRVFGCLGTIASSLAPIGIGLGSMFFDWIGHGVFLMYFGSGAIMTASVVLVSLNREFREYLSYDVASQPSTIPESSSPVEVRR